MPNTNKATYIFGNTEYTPILCRLFAVAGIVDDFSDAKSFYGVPRLKLSDIPLDCPIINTVNNSRAYQIQVLLVEAGFSDIQFIGDIINAFPESFNGTLLKTAQDGMKADYSKLIKLSELLEDDISRIEFKAILDFRLTLKIEHLSSFKVKIDEQYFEPFVTEIDFENLIDGGAYDGADSKRFTQLFPKYSEVFLLEPSDANILRVKRTLADLRDVTIIAACLGESEGTVQFSGEGTAAKIVDTGGQTVLIKTIDSFYSQRKTLVKLDIEGAEMSALRGAPRSLADANYGFAISAYHLADDLLNIIEILRDSCKSRKLYFRHYSGGLCESVLFAL